MKFVVDRRPSKTFLTDQHLWNSSETVAVNTESEMGCENGDGGSHMDIDGRPHRRSKKRRSEAVQDHDVEFSAAVMNVSSPTMFSADLENQPLPKPADGGKMKKSKKTEWKERVTKIDEKVTDDSDLSFVARSHREQKKHKSSVGAKNQKTSMEPQAENRATKSDDEISRIDSELLAFSHHALEKCKKKRPKNSVDVLDTKAGVCDSTSRNHRDNIESKSSTESPMTTIASAASPTGEKPRHKKRSKISVENAALTPTSGRDLREELFPSPKVSGKTEAAGGSGRKSAALPGSPSVITSEHGKEACDAKKLPGVCSIDSSPLSKLMEPDVEDSASAVISGSDVIENSTQFETRMTPVHGESNVVVKSPSNTVYVKPSLREIVLQSPPKAKKSPREMARLARDAEVPPVGAGQTTASAIDAQVYFVYVYTLCSQKNCATLIFAVSFKSNHIYLFQ